MPTWQQAKKAGIAHQRGAVESDREQHLIGLNHPFYLYSGTAIRLTMREQKRLSAPMSMRERSR